MEHSQELKGLGGWLILVGIGTVVAPFRLIYTFIPIYEPLFSEGTWAALTSVGSELYHPLWAPLLVGEILFNSLLIIACIYLIYLFLTAKEFARALVVAVVWIPYMLLSKRVHPTFVKPVPVTVYAEEKPGQAL